MWVPVVKKLIIKPEKATVSILKEFTGKDLITRHMSRHFVMSLVTLTSEEVNVKDEKSDRGYYVIEGNLLVRVGDLYGELSTGDAIFTPTGMSHTISGTGKLLVVFSPEEGTKDSSGEEGQTTDESREDNGFERRFRDLARKAVRGE
jgi:mannose-6-phosphate isomerase-like protein (cupin superfamily)